MQLVTDLCTNIHFILIPRTARQLLHHWQSRSSLPEPELEAITYNKCVVCRRIVVFIVSTLMRLHTQSEMESDATASLWRGLLLDLPWPNHRFRRPGFRVLFPPALAAFSVRLALCLPFSAFPADLVSYRIFLAMVLAFVPATSIRFRFVVEGIGRSGGGATGWEAAVCGGPCMIVCGSKSSTTVTMARCSSSSYSSAFSVSPSATGSPPIPDHSSSSMS
jgi:hypothetical protein